MFTGAPKWEVSLSRALSCWHCLAVARGSLILIASCELVEFLTFVVTGFLCGRSAGTLFHKMHKCRCKKVWAGTISLQTVTFFFLQSSTSGSEIAHFTFNISRVLVFLLIKRQGNLFTRAQREAALNSSSSQCGVWCYIKCCSFALVECERLSWHVWVQCSCLVLGWAPVLKSLSPSSTTSSSSSSHPHPHFPLRPMAAGPASVPQMTVVALGSRHGNKALAGPREPVC